MTNRLNQFHSKDSYLLTLSNLFERAGYYGIRSLLVLYLIDSSFNLSRQEAMTIYGIFTSALILTRIIGGVLGDLVIGNKNSMIIGIIMQAVGAFCLTIPSIYGIYLSLFLLLIGGGLYSPNLRANFGKQYLEKDKLLESGFVMLYLIVNIGAFLGILFIGIIGDKHGYNWGFILAGLIFISSLIPLILSKKERKNPATIDADMKVDKRIITISLFIIFNGIFWAINELNGNQILEIQNNFLEISALNLPKYFYQSLNFYSILPVGIFVFIFWWIYPQRRSFIKLAIGFILAAMSFGILWFIPSILVEQHVYLFIISIILLSIAELFITPVLDAVICRYSNPKYLAIIFSLVLIPTRLLLYIVSHLTKNNEFLQSKMGLLTGVIVLLILAMVTIILALLMKNTFKKSTS